MLPTSSSLSVAIASSSDILPRIFFLIYGLAFSFNETTRGGTHDINLKEQVFSLTPEFVAELMQCIDCAESPGRQNGLQMVMFSILYHSVGMFSTYTRYGSAI